MSILISVITASKNNYNTILDCVNSISRQTYPYVEHLIVDACSVDGTLELLTTNNSNDFILISEPDDGIYDALNKGILNSSGDIIGFLHADDYFADSLVLERIATAFQNPNVCAVYGDLIYVSKYNNNKVIRYWRSEIFHKNLIYKGWMPPHPTLYVRRSWYENIQYFDTSYKISADYLSVLKMFSSIDFKAIYIPEVLVKMRTGGLSNGSIKNIINKSREDLRALRSMEIGNYKLLFFKNFKKISQFIFR